ncbi:hypothetical protein R3P38DRAFT_3189105 [Favolaschia claudopus]|uniref:Uncharacterized protein n=1 Tax=Favolaschia claudopus TaxID=2862362 RepID=A0AAW0BW15_9AGAR
MSKTSGPVPRSDSAVAASSKSNRQSFCYNLPPRSPPSASTIPAAPATFPPSSTATAARKAFHLRSSGDTIATAPNHTWASDVPSGADRYSALASDLAALLGGGIALVSVRLAGEEGAGRGGVGVDDDAGIRKAKEADEEKGGGGVRHLAACAFREQGCSSGGGARWEQWEDGCVIPLQTRERSGSMLAPPPPTSSSMVIFDLYSAGYVSVSSGPFFFEASD